MATARVGVVFIFALANLMVLSGCGYDGPTYTVEELKLALRDDKKKLTVVDVRPSSLFKRGHIPGSINYPLETLFENFDEIAAVNGEVAVVCVCGRRSLAAVKKLSLEGVTARLVLKGMKGWTENNYAVETGR